MGTKKLYMKMKTTAAYPAGLLETGKEVEIASAIMQHPMPKPENMKSARRPKRSMVKKATNDERNFHVKVPPVKILDSSAERPRFCWNMTGAYTEMRLLPLICW